MNFYPESFRLSKPTDRTIQVERDFGAAREMVFDAFTKPEWVRRWLLGPGGWTMPVCEIDLRVGGRYRYVWRNEASGMQMGMGGEFLEVVAAEKLVASEKFDDAWYPGEAQVTTRFEGRGEITRVIVEVRYESTEARDTAARSGMERGMAAGYARLEEALSEAPAEKFEWIERPRTVETAPVSAALVHVTVPRSQIQAAMGPARAEVLAAVRACRAEVTGPWFDHHLKMSPEAFDFETGVPVSKTVPASGRVMYREMAAIRVAETVYQGPYENLSGAWREFGAWIQANGHVAGSDLYQWYEVSTDAETKPAEYRTKLWRPITE